MSFFAVENLTAGYGGRPVLDGVCFAVEPGRIVGVVGANGSGKTTLLKAVCGILPHGGSCTLEGSRLEELSPRQLAGRCGYIPQRSGPGTMLLGGLLGGILLTGADILARSVAAVELPVSIFTSLLGAPFLIFLIVKGRRQA